MDIRPRQSCKWSSHLFLWAYRRPSFTIQKTRQVTLRTMILGLLLLWKVFFFFFYYGRLVLLFEVSLTFILHCCSMRLYNKFYYKWSSWVDLLFFKKKKIQEEIPYNYIPVYKVLSLILSHLLYQKSSKLMNFGGREFFSHLILKSK